MSNASADVLGVMHDLASRPAARSALAYDGTNVWAAGYLANAMSRINPG